MPSDRLVYDRSAWLLLLDRIGNGLRQRYRGPEELDRLMINLVGRFGVECVNAQEVEKKYPRRMTGGWELKPYAIIHSRFAEVLLLDADNVPIGDPSFLFDEPAYQKTGAIFWPDYGRLAPKRQIWTRSKKRCWLRPNRSF